MSSQCFMERLQRCQQDVSNIEHNQPPAGQIDQHGHQIGGPINQFQSSNNFGAQDQQTKCKWVASSFFTFILMMQLSMQKVWFT